MKVWPVFKKELRVYVTSPVAWVVGTMFTLIGGYFFYAIYSYYASMSMRAMMQPQMGAELSVAEHVLRPLFSNLNIILLFLMPLVTMRLFAEERKAGTIELLLTYPVRDGAVLAGKYLAALALYVALLALTLVWPALVLWTARGLEWGPLASGYLGLLLMGGAFLAVGLLFSSLTENQIVAAALTFMTLLMFWVIGWAADSAGGTLGRVLAHLSLFDRFESFGKGVLDTKDIVFFLDVIVVSLFLALKSLEARRWRG